MIKIINGNLFDTDATIICHQCNCQGVMGSGVAAEVKSRYPKVYKIYRDAYNAGDLKLGTIIFAPAGNGQIIANLLAQDKYGWKCQYTDYSALRECIQTVKKYADVMSRTEYIKIAFPYGMGSVRGGGDWNTVYKIIEEELGQYYDVEIWRLNNA